MQNLDGVMQHLLRDAPFLRKRMPLREKDDRSKIHHRAEIESGGPQHRFGDRFRFQRIADHRQHAGPGKDVVDRLHGVVFGVVDGDPPAAANGGNGIGKSVCDIARPRNSEIQHHPLLLLIGVAQRMNLPDLIQNDFGVLQKGFPLYGGDHSGGCAAEKRRSELILQLPDGAAQIGLADEEAGGRLGDGAAVRHLDRIAQMLKIHTFSSPKHRAGRGAAARTGPAVFPVHGRCTNRRAGKDQLRVRTFADGIIIQEIRHKKQCLRTPGRLPVFWGCATL